MSATIPLLLVLGFSIAASATGSAGRSGPSARHWLGPQGDLLPWRSDEEVLEFLRTARIVSATTIHEGINRPQKLLLERDGVRAHAIFRGVNKRFESGERLYWKQRSTFRDHYAFECAAFELSRLLGIDRVPPAVVRSHGGRQGSVQIWVESATDVGARRERGATGPSKLYWYRENQTQIVFDTLIRNEDRNVGNLLVDGNWNVWMIDHTRCFAPDPRLRDADKIRSLSRALWQNLRTLDHGLVEKALSPYLTDGEMKALLVRWDRLVAHLEALIDRQGEASVVWDEPGE